jgi:hypothetical protein
VFHVEILCHKDHFIITLACRLMQQNYCVTSKCLSYTSFIYTTNNALYLQM